MSDGKKQVVLLTEDLALTSSYVTADDGINGDPLLVFSESYIQLDFIYTTGAAETDNVLDFIIEFNSEDDGSGTWIQESSNDLASTGNTISPLTHHLEGASGATAYTGTYARVVTARAMRVRVKETGAAVNPGTVTVKATITSAPSSGYNLQKFTATLEDAPTIDIGNVQTLSATSSTSGTVTCDTGAGGDQIAAANAKRAYCLLQNTGSVNLYFGAGTVTSSYPFMVPGGTAAWESQEAVKGLAASGTCTVAFTDYTNS